MKRTAFLVGLAILVAPLTGCANQQDYFDQAFTLAQDSFATGDYEMASAHLADALAAVPDSSAGKALQGRIDDAVFSQGVLQQVNSQAESSDWNQVLTSALQLSNRHPDYEVVVEITSANFILNMTNFIGDEDEGIEPRANELEAMLIQASSAEEWGLIVPEELLTESAVLVSGHRGQQLTQLVKESDAETALTLLEELLANGFFTEANFGDQIAEITSAYVAEVIGESKSLTKKKNLDGARRLMNEANKRVPNNEAIEAERTRVAELVQDAKDALAKAEEAAKQKAIKALRCSEDTFEGITWCYDRATYSTYAGNKFLLYLGQRNNGSPWLRLRFMMYDDTWHFFERIVMDVDGTKYNFNPGYFDVNRDNGGGDIWEWYDLAPSAANLTMVEKVINSKTTRIRYINDDNFYEERTVTSAQKRALANVLLAFEALGG
jgi:hypothetical protein